MASLGQVSELRAIAVETKKVLPEILDQLKPRDTTTSTFYNYQDLELLNPEACPKHELPEDDLEPGRKGTRIRVSNQDTFDAAIALQPDTTFATEKKPVAILNLASERHPGGGWERGTLAQEEALCYRSSLYLSLKWDYYPFPPTSGIYSPTVVIIRDAMSRGHKLLAEIPADDLPVTSVITVAAQRGPKLARDLTYTYNYDRELMKSKIRVILRMAAQNGHTKLVLGAIGCGVFGNPPKDVAQCFLEVFREREFEGGWWEGIVFAVMDNMKGGGKDGNGNFGIFYRTLNGVVV
ncbi:hypothetical protein K432DRAFT_392114 [Lepidopterella palustris CBS 459.81]|uniref:Microbial-type PARG catalytic domain-containing protein n=1 Tax=Lepidopterella palustris CBS 459.81 TaxID=1314670 RepID=A0A8E2ECD4_9PEZI|nr:hypothetical protein K432DRAFT_392114 [Lepidopterella palustris CBS 459.81]